MTEPTRTLIITAGIHGDEPEGLALAQQIRALIKRDGLCSRPVNVLFHGMLNPEGFAAGTREDASGRDLNREWTTEGNRSGSASCAALWADIVAAHEAGHELLVVDCHSMTGAPGVFHAGPKGQEVAENRFRLVARTAGWVNPGTLTYACEARGVRAVAVEASKGDSCMGLATAVHQALWSWAGLGPAAQ